MTDTPHTSVRAGLLVLYASIFLLALNGIFAKLIPLDATSITQVRSVIACAALVLFLMLQGSPLRLTSLKEYVGVYGLGILLGVHWITYFYSMKVATVAIGMLALFSYPVITVLIEPLFKKRCPRIIDILAALVVMLGVFMMVADDILGGELDSGSFQGAMWGLFSAFLFSLRNTSQKYLYPKVNSFSLMAHQTLAVGILLVPFVDIAGLRALSIEKWATVILLGCLSTAMAHTLLTMSLKRLSAKTVGLISCITPVFGALFAWLVLGEIPSIMVYVGGATILAVAAWETLKGKAQT